MDITVRMYFLKKEVHCFPWLNFPYEIKSNIFQATNYRVIYHDLPNVYTMIRNHISVNGFTKYIRSMSLLSGNELYLGICKLDTSLIIDVKCTQW